MRVVIQRSKKAQVKVRNKIVGEINEGVVILVGFKEGDTKDIIKKMANKIGKLRIFEDQKGLMNLDIQEVKGEFLVVSQFTLYANPYNGNRPSFKEALNKIEALELYEVFKEELESLGPVFEGEYGADMQVELVNDGPVTIILDSDLF